METWQTLALAVATAAFAAYILYQVRPMVGGKRTPLRTLLKAARARIDAAKDDEERASALCDAGDACAAAIGRSGAASQFYLRAMRLRPADPEPLKRAIQGLSKKPRALEKLLWRRLGSEPWTGETQQVAKISLAALSHVYAHGLRDRIRSRAIAHAHEALEDKA